MLNILITALAFAFGLTALALVPTVVLAHGVTTGSPLLILAVIAAAALVVIALRRWVMADATAGETDE